MARIIGAQEHLPVEIFGFIPEDTSRTAGQIRAKRTCPFMNLPCIKKPYRTEQPANGSCTVSHLGDPHVICPKRFLESDRSLLLAEAELYLGTGGILVLVPEVRLGENIGQVDWVAAKVGQHGQIEDFVGIEIMANQTTQTGPLTDALSEFGKTGRFSSTHYGYGLNTYMQIKTFFTQAVVKGNIFEAWSKNLVWVMQDVLFDNWMKRTDFRLSPQQDGKHIAFAILSLNFDSSISRYRFSLRERLFANYGEIIEVYSRQKPPDISGFLSTIVRKMNGG